MAKDITIPINFTGSRYAGLGKSVLAIPKGAIESGKITLEEIFDAMERMPENTLVIPHEVLSSKKQLTDVTYEPNGDGTYRLVMHYDCIPIIDL